jgi:hypothetical protein
MPREKLYKLGIIGDMALGAYSHVTREKFKTMLKA